MGKGTLGHQIVRSTGKGRFGFRIPENGMVVLSIDGYPDGRGHDLEYSASWGLRKRS